MPRRLALLLMGLASGAALALPPDQIYDRAAALTWQVRALAADEKLLGSASGIAVAPGKLLTSCGALARARQLQLRRGNAIYDAKLEFPDVERDLCQLDAPGLAASAPALGSARGLRPGRKLYVIGYGLGSAPTLGEGLVSAVHDAGTANERIQTTIPAARGLLGAGVYDEEARLVGVVTASPKDAAASLFAVPADWITEVAARGGAALAARSKLAAEAAAAARGNAATGMPAAGTTWVYSITDRMFSRRGAEVTVHAQRVDGTAVEETVSGQSSQSVRRVVNAAEFRILEQPVGAGLTLIEAAPYLLAGNGGKAPGEISGVTGYPTGGSGLGNWLVRTRVHDWEEVSVPAGTYRALRVEFKGKRDRQIPGGIGTGSFQIMAWYAAEAGRLVKLEHKAFAGNVANQSRAYGYEVVELLSYRPPR